MLIENNIFSNSVLIGVMLICTALSPIMSFVPNGIVLLVGVPLILLAIANKEKIKSPQLVFLLYIVIYFIYSMLRGNMHPTVITLFIEFLLYGFIFIYITNYPYNAKIILRTIVLLGIIAIPIQIFQIDYADTSDSGTWMNASYNIIRIAAAGILLLFIDESKWIKVVCIIEIIASSVFLFSLGSRGAILGAVIAFVLGIIYKNNKPLKIISWRMWLLLLFVLVIIIYFPIIATTIYELAEDIGINSYSLYRIVHSLESGSSMSVGRDIIYAKCVEQFMSNPIFGNGIGACDNYSGGYPHNLFIQILFEGGVFWGFPLLCLSVFPFFVLNGKMEQSDRFLIIYLIGAGYVQLLFSSYLWMSPIYWFLIGICLKKVKI